MESYLYHYGIKGQTWGVRRFQNEDGTLTEEGRRRYDVGESSLNNKAGSFFQSVRKAFQKDKKEDAAYYSGVKKEKEQKKELSKRRIQLQDQYISKGFTKEQAEAKAYKMERLEMALKIAGAVAVTAAVAYGAYKGHKMIQRYADKTIRKGATIQRVTDNPNDVLMNRPGFISSDKGDFVKYRGMYGRQVTEGIEGKRVANKLARLKGKPVVPLSDGAYAVEAKTAGKLKIAGEKTGNKVFNDLMKNDPEFSRRFQNLTKNGTPVPLRWGRKISDYEHFNTKLAGLHNNPDNKYLRDKFYNALKAKGYDGALDLNDRRFSGYVANKSAIIFDLKNKLDPVKAVKLDPSVIKTESVKAANVINKQLSRENAFKKLFSRIRKVSIGSLGLGSIGLAGKAATSAFDNKNASRFRRIINEYRAEHPNTRLSDQQILENELGS